MRMMHTAPISGVACNQGLLVATAGYDDQVILWDAEGHRPISRASHDHLANMCTFSPDGKYLASSSSDCSARIWTVPDLRLVSVLADHDDDVEMVAFSPRSDAVATCSRDHMTRIFDLSGKLIREFVGHTADVISVGWTPDGDGLVTSSDDGTIRRWDVHTGSELSCFEIDGVETDTIVITERGVIVAGDDEGRISVFDSGAVKQTVLGHDAGIKRLIYSPQTATVVSLSYDRSLKAWHLQDGALTPLFTATLPPEIWPRSCAFLTEGRLAFATFGSTYAEYDIGMRKWTSPGYEPSQSVNAVISHAGALYKIGDSGVLYCDDAPLTAIGSLCNFLVPCGGHLLTGGQMGAVYDALSGECVYQHRSPLNCGCSFEVDGAGYAAIGSYTGEVIVIHEASGALVFAGSEKMHANAIKGLATDGITIFGVSADRSAALMAIDGFSILSRWDDSHSKIANGCCVVNRSVYASVSRDLCLRLWNEHGVTDEIKSPLRNSLKCITATDDLIAVGDYGGRVGIYNSTDRKWLSLARPTTSGISSITPIGAREFVASSYDGNIYRVYVEGNSCMTALLP